VLVEPLIPPAKRGGGKRTANMREVVNGVMYVLSTRLPVALHPQGPAAAQHGRWLFLPVGLERSAGENLSRTLTSLRQCPLASN
jgi:hypothetical protein